ncbi:MAG: hypothetical protein LBO74_12640 [Candidatus Symbiothrix sp.]|jgi:hypothetical protein|nr:hypothetical protein [Candidatus Symbiothrix sp.]
MSSNITKTVSPELFYSGTVSLKKMTTVISGNESGRAVAFSNWTPELTPRGFRARIYLLGTSKKPADKARRSEKSGVYIG